MDYEELIGKLNLNIPSINEVKTRIEREWWKKIGDLTEIPSVGDTYCLIKRLRPEEYKPENTSQSGKESNLAIQEVKIAIEEIGRRWRQKLKDEGFDEADRFYLSITSLYRNQEKQKELIKNNSNAVDNSSHTKGAAADIHANGFYLEEESGDIRPINSRNYNNPEKIKKIQGALLRTLREMEEQGLINLLPEYAPRENSRSTFSCFHICPNPKIEEILNNKL